MIDYEILLLLDQDLAEEPQAEVVTRVRELIEKGGGTFTRHDVWGKRKLAYEIDKKRRQLPPPAVHLDAGVFDEFPRAEDRRQRDASHGDPSPRGSCRATSGAVP